MAAPTTERFTVGGLERTALLERATSRPTRPVLLLLHGHGGSGEQFRRQAAGFVALARRDLVHLIWADGLPAPETIADTPRSWNAGPGAGYAHDHQVDDLAFFDALVEHAIVRWNAAATRIYVAGMSLGAMLAYRVACQRRDTLAGVAGVACCQNWDWPRPRPLPMLHVHGLTDGVQKYSGGVAPDGYRTWAALAHQQWWQTTNGRRVEARLLSHSGGHIWPTAADGLDACREIWSFFGLDRF